VSGAESFLDELAWRGLLHQVTSDALGAHLASGRRTGYGGFDPTSDSLTVGNFIPIKLLAHLQRHGHRPIVLMGGGTGLIGDPSGKSSERQLLSAETVAANVARQREIFARVLDLSPTLSNRATILDNAAWLGKLGYLEVHLVHRVFLHDPAGLRLPAPPPRRGMHAADGRQRPVREHRERR
jgi:tyrosyl-tRNA synthetase